MQTRAVQQDMFEITRFNPALARRLPETHALLLDAGLRVHDAVDRVTLHGSRGPQGGARPDSDIDLCLVVNGRSLAATPQPEGLLREVLSTTLGGWCSKTEPDLAAVFDKSGCDLRCLAVDELDPHLCPSTLDCMGLFKTQGRFDGFVSGPAVDCGKMYPLMTIWTREDAVPEGGVSGDA